MVQAITCRSPGLDMSFAPEQRLAGFQAIGAGRLFPPKANRWGSSFDSAHLSTATRTTTLLALADEVIK
jgi:hypothetical protein